MRNYKLLLNSTYLYIREHRITKPNFSEIARELSLTRQTVAKEYAQIEGEIDLNISNYHTDITNKYIKALAILRDIDSTIYTEKELSELLGVSRATLSKYINHVPKSAVYAIKYNGEVIYIGSTSDYESRCDVHLNGIKYNEDRKIGEYLKDKDLDKMEIVPIIFNLPK